MWAIRQLPASTAHWEPLEGADGATLIVTSASLSLSFSLPPPLFFFVCVLFLPLPCGLHPSDWHACSRPTLSHHISPPAIRGLTALRSLGNCFGCEQNFKHRVLPDPPPPLASLSLSLSLGLWLLMFLFLSRSLFLTSALPPSPDDPRDSRCASECVMKKEKVRRRWRECGRGSKGRGVGPIMPASDSYNVHNGWREISSLKQNGHYFVTV